MVHNEVRYQEYPPMPPSQIIWSLSAQEHSIGTTIIKITSRSASWSYITTISLSISLRRPRKRCPLCPWRTRLLRSSMRKSVCFQWGINSVIISSKLAQRKICLAGKFVNDIGCMRLQKPSKSVIRKYTWIKCRKS